MRKAILLTILFAASICCATTTVTGNLKDLTTANVTSRTTVNAILRGCGGNQPRVHNQALVVGAGGVWSATFTPNASGVISGTLFSNTTEVECGGEHNTWYGFVVVRDGKPGPERAYVLSDGAFNLNTASESQPSITAYVPRAVLLNPTGDQVIQQPTASTLQLNGQFFIGPTLQATNGSNKDSHNLRIAGSLWNGTAAADDHWDLHVAENSSALTDGSDLTLDHVSISGGAGRFHLNTDMIIGPPASANASANYNSFAWDNEGSYWDGSSVQFNLWEIAVTTTPTSGTTVNSRENILPLFTGACVGCTAELAIGGSGTLSDQGNYSGRPAWLFPALPYDGFTLQFGHTLTANRTVTFPDANSNTIRPLADPGSDSKWVKYVDSTGLQNRTRPVCADLSNAAASCSTDTTNASNISTGTLAVGRVAAAGTTGQIQFNGGTNPAADSNLFWDNSSKLLGIGQAVPTVPLHVKTTGSGAFPQAVFENAAAGGASFYYGVTDTGNGAGGGKYLINNSTSSSTAILTIDSATANVGINQTAPGKTLDVNGSANFARSTYAGVNAVAFSATPTFNLSLGNTQTITLTANVTSSTATNVTAGQVVNFIICQDSTGSRTFVWPTQFKGTMTIGSTLSKCSAQAFVAKDSSTLYAISTGALNQ